MSEMCNWHLEGGATLSGSMLLFFALKYLPLCSIRNDQKTITYQSKMQSYHQTISAREMISVVIVEDNKTIRDGLEIILSSTKGFACKGVYSNCEDMLEGIELYKPDIVLIDINLPGMSGIEGIRRIKKIVPGCTVLVLVIYKESDQIYDALCAGAIGFIEKNLPPARMISSIKTAYKGGSLMSAQLALKIQNYFNSRKAADECRLTNTEKQVLTELVSGNNFRAIADKLCLDLDAVQVLFRGIYEKLQKSFSPDCVPGKK